MVALMQSWQAVWVDQNCLLLTWFSFFLFFLNSCKVQLWSLFQVLLTKKALSLCMIYAQPGVKIHITFRVLLKWICHSSTEVSKVSFSSSPPQFKISSLLLNFEGLQYLYTVSKHLHSYIHNMWKSVYLKPLRLSQSVLRYHIMWLLFHLVLVK